MATFRTSRGRAVHHCHVGDAAPCDYPRVITDDEAERASAWLARNFPGVVEVRRATYDYNCFGRAFARSHGWFQTSPTSLDDFTAQTFLEDDFVEGSLDDPAIGDVVIYRIGERVTHAAVVTRVEGGRITQLVSKWGQMPEVLHRLREVPPRHGDPVELHRRRPGVINFSAAGETEAGGEKMANEEFSSAFQQFTSEDVHFLLMLASTRAVREDLIASLPAVQSLLERDEEAGPAVVEFFKREETQRNEDASAIALYLLQRLPSDAAAHAVAHHISEGKVSAINRQLAAQAFLVTAHIQPSDEEDIVEVAAREANAFLERE